MVLWIILSIVVVMAIVGIVFVNQPSFGRIPRGERLARIERSPITGMGLSAIYMKLL